MIVVVTDVSVFFDLYKIQILPEFFGLDWEIHTTDFVYNEILRAGQQEAFEVFRRGKQLKILSFSDSEEKEVREFKTKRNIRSIADKTILWKAIELNAILLTCDKKLKLKKQGFGRLNEHKVAASLHSFAKVAEISACPTVSWAERVDALVSNGSLRFKYFVQ